MTVPKIQKASLFTRLNCKLPPGEELAVAKFVDKVETTAPVALLYAATRALYIPSSDPNSYHPVELLELVVCGKEVCRTVSTIWVLDQIPETNSVARLPDGSTVTTFLVRDVSGRPIKISSLPSYDDKQEPPKQTSLPKRKISPASFGMIAKSKSMLIEADSDGMFICKLVGRGGKLTLVTDCHGEAIRNKTERQLIRRITAVNSKITLASQI